jgi:GT2 family glycosyltransferase
LQGDRRVEGQDSEFFEDTELQDRVRQGGGAVVFCPAAAVRHRVERRTVTPRRICSTAFTRGRIAGLKQPVPDRRVPLGLLVLAGRLAQWGVLSLAYRVAPQLVTFERVRRTAFSAGFALDALRSQRSTGWLAVAAGRIVFPIHGIILRCIPDLA